jgi:hypothetical protein
VKHVKWVVMLFAGAMLVTSVVVAQDGTGGGATTQPSDRSDRADRADRADSAERPRRARLVKPWADLASLREEQRSKIVEIHAAASEAKRRIDEQERADILALLTDEQKSELDAMVQRDREAQRERDRARRAERAKQEQDDKDDGEKKD